MADYDLMDETGGGLLGGGGGNWLGNLFNFGGGRSTTADLYGDLFSKKQLAAIQQRESQAKFKGLLDVLSQAAAPSKFRKDYGQILGQAGGAMMGAEGGDKAATTALGGQKTAAQIAQLKQELAAQEAARKINELLYGKIFGAGGAGAPAPAPLPGAPTSPPPGPTPDAPAPNPAGAPVNPFAPPPIPYAGPGSAPAPRPFGMGAPGAGSAGPLPPTPPSGPDLGAGAGMPPVDPASQYAMMMGGGLLGAGGGGAQLPPTEGEGDTLPPQDTVIPSGPGGLLNPDMVKLAALGGGSGGGRDPLDIIAKYESGGRNIMQQVVPPGGGYNPSVGRVTGPSTAQGPWQITNTTWKGAAPKVGIDPEQFPNAMSVPVEDQRRVAQQLYNERGYADWAPYNRALAREVGWKGAQYTEGSGGGSGPAGSTVPASSGGVSNVIPGLGVSPAELALVNSINEQAKLGSPFKGFLDAYYKDPAYLGAATTAQEAAKDPFAKGLATHSSQLQLFRELATKGLSIVPDGKGGYTMGTIAGAPDALAAGDNAKTTGDQKEYQSYVKDQQMRGQPVLSQFDWDIARRKSSATSINTTEGMEAAQTRARLAIDQKAAQEATEVAMAARRTMPLLDQVLELADKTPGGWAGPASATMAKAFSAVGIPVSEGMSNAELLQSIGQRLIPIVREPGATAAVEMDAYLRAVPGLMQSQEGRRKVADMTKAIAQRSIEIARVYRENVGAPNLYEKLAELDKPVFTPEQKTALEPQPAVRTYNPATKRLE